MAKQETKLIDKTRILPREATTEDEVKREPLERLTTPEESGPPGKTAITLLWSVTKILSPAPSGAIYRWPGSGSTVMVANEDVEFVMSHNRSGNRGCCGGGRRIYFQLGG